MVPTKCKQIFIGHYGTLSRAPRISLVPTNCRQIYRTLLHTVVSPKDLLGPHMLLHRTHLTMSGAPGISLVPANARASLAFFSCALFAQLAHFACTPNPSPCWGHGHRCLASVVKANSPVQAHQMASCGGRTRYSSEARYTIVKCGRALRCSTVLRVRCNGQAMSGTSAKMNGGSNLVVAGVGDVQVQVNMCVPS